MYKMKYIFGQTIKYNGQRHKIQTIRFTSGGVLYKLSGIKEWICENDISE